MITQLNFRNFLLIAAGTLVVIALGIASYFYLTSRGVVPTDTGGELPRGTVDTASSGGEVRTPGSGLGSGAEVPGGETEPILFQIHDKPIVSAITFSRPTGPVVRFMEQGSGNVFEYVFATKQKKRISNTSVPQIDRAVWAKNGSAVAFQYVENEVIHSAVGYFSATSTEADGPFEKIFFFPDGIRSLALSPDGKQLAYTTSIDSSGALFVSNSNGTSPKVLAASPLLQWSVSWPTAGYVILSSGYGEQGGISYRVDVPSGEKTTLLVSQKVFTGVAGSAGGNLIAPQPQTGTISLYDQKFGTFSKLSMSTWLDKCSVIETATSTMLCAVVPSSVFANRVGWSRGEFASNDSLVAVNFTDNYIQLLIPENEFSDKRFDMENVRTTPDRKYAVFKNRIDGFLWGVRIPYGIE